MSVIQAVGRVSPKADIIKRTVTDRAWDISALYGRHTEQQVSSNADAQRLSCWYLKAVEKRLIEN